MWGNMCTCVRVSTNLESPPIMGNLRCDWAPMSIDFISFRHLKLNGLKPEIGSEVCLCVGKVLGTPRHPLRNGYLPSSVPFIC